LHDHGFALAVVFASNVQDAFDTAVDENKLDQFKIHLENEDERDDYMTSNPPEMAEGFDPECPEYVAPDGTKYWWKIEPAFLGNASEPFDIDSVGVMELPNPPMSWVALFNAANAK